MISVLLSILIFFLTSSNLIRLVQVKEYFFPSIYAHFDLPSSYKIFFRGRELILWGIWLILILLNFIPSNLYETFPLSLQLTILILSLINYLISNLYFLLIIFVIVLYLRWKNIKLINWTLKGLFITFLVLLINYLLLKIDNSLIMVALLFTSLVQFLIVLSSTYIANILTRIYSKNLYRKTKNKIQKWLKEDKKRIVIGITGSYGKSSLKEILAQLLETEFKVLKSPLRLNAEIGLCQFILKEDLNNYDILVLEMGARSIGEIDTMVKIFQPKIAFLTGLAPQHLATFGSFKNIIIGKLEIFNRVIPDGIAFLNGNDKFVYALFDQLPISRKYLYSTESGHFYSLNEIYSLENTNFDFVYPDGIINLTTNLIGKHFLENLIGALACCYILGIKPYKLKEALNNLRLLPHQFEIVNRERPVIIDDSYNANIVGVEKGAEFFLNIPLKCRILVFGGILELGSETKDIYSDLIKIFSQFDVLILTFEDFIEVFYENMPDKVYLYKEGEILKPQKITWRIKLTPLAAVQTFLNNYNKEELGIIVLGRIPQDLLKIIRNLKNE